MHTFENDSMHICVYTLVYIYRHIFTFENFLQMISTTSSTCHKCIYIHMYTYTYMYTLLRMSLHMYVYIPLYICIHIFTFGNFLQMISTTSSTCHECVYTCMYIHVCIYMCTHFGECFNTCMCI